MELSEALNNRKSTRHYIDKKVDKSLLDEMLSAANLAPSWKNSQTPRFYVATGEKSKDAVREALPEFNRKNSENASAYIVTTVVLNRSGFDKDGTAVTEIGNGWGYYDLGLNNMALLLWVSVTAKNSEKNLTFPKQRLLSALLQLVTLIPKS